MSNEPTGVVQGQPEVTPQPTNVMVAPEETKAPEQPTQEAPPQKYDGKSVDDLLRQMEEKDRYIAEVNERAARAEHEAVLTRNLVEQFARDRNVRQEPTLDVTDEEYIASPAKATAKILDSRLNQFKAEIEKKAAEQELSRARTAFEQGKNAAVKANPNLFRGIETTVANQLDQTIASGLRAGQGVDVEALRSPEFWTNAAITHRLSKGEKPLDVLKYFASTSPSPVPPVHTETPSPGGPSKAAPVLSDEDKVGAKFFGVTEEQWLKAKGKK